MKEVGFNRNKGAPVTFQPPLFLSAAAERRGKKEEPGLVLGPALLPPFVHLHLLGAPRGSRLYKYKTRGAAAKGALIPKDYFMLFYHF